MKSQVKFSTSILITLAASNHAGCVIPYESSLSITKIALALVAADLFLQITLLQAGHLRLNRLRQNGNNRYRYQPSAIDVNEMSISCPQWSGPACVVTSTVAMQIMENNGEWK